MIKKDVIMYTCCMGGRSGYIRGLAMQHGQNAEVFRDTIKASKVPAHVWRRKGVHTIVAINDLPANRRYRPYRDAIVSLRRTCKRHGILFRLKRFKTLLDGFRSPQTE